MQSCTSNRLSREVSRLVVPQSTLGGTTGHKVRRLIDNDDPSFTDPFLLMGEDWMPHGAYAVHPHRGMETVTFVLEGSIGHYDNMGSSGMINAGDAQLMTAGRGVLHEENALPGTTAHTLQLWINLPSALKMTEPRYQDLKAAEMPGWEDDGVSARVFSGESRGVAAGTLNHVPLTMLELTLQPQHHAAVDLPPADNAFVFVIEGSAAIGRDCSFVGAGQLAWLTRRPSAEVSNVEIQASSACCRMLIFAATPIGEPVVFGGPFVMNTECEIQQAFRDFANGRF